MAAEVSTDPLGVISVTVAANSDAILAVPLNRATVFHGMVESKAGNVITVKGTPNWAVSQFVANGTGQPNTYAIQIVSGVNEGLVGKIIANTANSLTVQLDGGDSLTAVVGDQDDTLSNNNGDLVSIMPYWTPSSLMPTDLPTGTEMYVFDNNSPGQNASPTTLLQYFAGFGWFETIGFTNQSQRPLLFGTGFIVRNNSATPSKISFTGSVPMTKHRVVLRTLASNTPQDQTIGYASPVAEALSTLSLGAQNTDELYIFDNSAPGMNKSPTLLLVHYGGRWYNSINFADVTDSVTIQPGNAMIYRKAATATPQAFVWSNLQAYLD